MLNKVMIIGRVGQDPELRYTQSGMPMLNLNVATDESYNDRDGNRQDRTEWHRVAVFERAAENCATYLRKGSLIFVEGKLQTRKWQDNQGQERQITEIRAQRVQFLDRKGDAGVREERPQGRGDSRPERSVQGAARSGGQRRPAGVAEETQAYPSEGVSFDDDQAPF